MKNDLALRCIYRALAECPEKPLFVELYQLQELGMSSHEHLEKMLVDGGLVSDCLIVSYGLEHKQYCFQLAS